jgi:hypothetical protein
VVDDRANLRLEAHFEHPIGLVENQVPSTKGMGTHRHQGGTYKRAARNKRHDACNCQHYKHATRNATSSDRCDRPRRCTAERPALSDDRRRMLHGKCRFAYETETSVEGKLSFAGSLEPMPFRSCGRAGGLSRRGGMPPIARRATPRRAVPRRAAPCRAVLPTGTYVSTYVTRLSFVPFILTRSISLPGVAITISAPGGQRRCMLRMVGGRGRASERADHLSNRTTERANQQQTNKRTNKQNSRKQTRKQTNKQNSRKQTHERAHARTCAQLLELLELRLAAVDGHNAERVATRVPACARASMRACRTCVRACAASRLCVRLCARSCERLRPFPPVIDLRLCSSGERLPCCVRRGAAQGGAAGTLTAHVAGCPS